MNNNMDLNYEMFCYQCEQTAGCNGCTGAAGVCGKDAAVAYCSFYQCFFTVIYFIKLCHVVALIIKCAGVLTSCIFFCNRYVF